MTQPDRKKGRGLSLSSTEIKSAASENKLKVYQPHQVNTQEAIKLLKDLNPDLFVVVAYGQILSTEVLHIPKVFAINAHASILPKYRGAAPINWAIIKGEDTSGVTIIKMTEKMDAGPIIAQKTLEINELDTSITLEDNLSRVAAQLLINALVSMENNNYKLIPQDESKISFAPKLKKEDGLISWNKSAQDIYNLVRGCLGWPGAFTYYKGRLFKIYKAHVCASECLPACSSVGEIIEVSKEGVIVATAKDNLVIEELQIEGKRRMKVVEFIAGHKISAGEILG